MGAYCLKNNFRAPPPGFKRPKQNNGKYNCYKNIHKIAVSDNIF